MAACTIYLCFVKLNNIATVYSRGRIKVYSAYEQKDV